MKNEATVTPITAEKPVRKKSPETALKQEMAKIKRELVSIDKTLDSFKEMKKEVDGAEARKTELNTRLEKIKADLRKTLGLD